MFSSQISPNIETDTKMRFYFRALLITFKVETLFYRLFYDICISKQSLNAVKIIILEVITEYYANQFDHVDLN